MNASASLLRPLVMTVGHRIGGFGLVPRPIRDHSTRPILVDSRPVDVHITFDGRVGRTGAIYRQLRAAVLDGRLRPGDALPPTRELAEQLGVARATIVGAYEQLAGEGFIAGRSGSGTFVTDVAAHAAGPTATVRAEPGTALEPRPIWDNLRISRPFRQTDALDFRTGLGVTWHFRVQAKRLLGART